MCPRGTCSFSRKLMWFCRIVHTSSFSYRELYVNFHSYEVYYNLYIGNWQFFFRGGLEIKDRLKETKDRSYIAECEHKAWKSWLCFHWQLQNFAEWAQILGTPEKGSKGWNLSLERLSRKRDWVETRQGLLQEGVGRSQWALIDPQNAQSVSERGLMSGTED